MPKAKECGASCQAWNLVRLVLLSTRRGRAFKLHLRLLMPKFLKTIGQAAIPCSSIGYSEREITFGKTSAVHVKMHRPGLMRFMFPCIKPKVDFDKDFDNEDGVRVCYQNDSARKTFFLENGDQEECFYDSDSERVGCREEEQDIDSRAEEFIANFYEQIKLQRQMSLLRYSEMLNRGAS